MKKPFILNTLILCVATLLNTTMLYIASHASWWWAIVCALIFSLSNNTLFSLLHECVHGSFADSPALNRWFGRLSAWWYPTGFSIQKAFHIEHHQHNRSATEQFDILHPEDVRWLKYAQWYAIYTGIYWAVNALGALVYSLTPAIFRRFLVRLFGKQGSLQSGADSYISALEKLHPFISRLEIWTAWLFQTALFVLLDLNWSGWLLCYGAFGLQWSSLQYTDHAFSPLDCRNGAWNLIVPKWVRWFFLNYHYHQAHHQYPEISWIYLPNYARYGVRFWTVWRHCITGPKPVNKLPHIPIEPL